MKSCVSDSTVIFERSVSIAVVVSSVVGDVAVVLGWSEDDCQNHIPRAIRTMTTTKMIRFLFIQGSYYVVGCAVDWVSSSLARGIPASVVAAFRTASRASFTVCSTAFKSA